ncbi:hypothetical protein RFN57_27875 [Streptomyces violaceochromogenes]|uniref:PE-PGRS family protein n=1 Tax=Streptomyces violaceochromogenes TaxID=67377 RepID=A0ABU6M2R7_9ACTN|nr:hypothetical protein [Streptomyces violaceochromogenes]MEC7056072.1 hypothetical protein [Streptomyces violaceochromogenes]GHC68963.1 hypothetical protein GCM10010309_35610 [Streptomyces violaceochromogenes]
MEHTEQEQLDWFQQQPEHPAAPHTDADPVRTVWQLPRFHLGGRRFTGRIDHALVCVTRKGAYETFLPPDRPTSVRRYVAVYEVDTDPHAFQLNVPVPSEVDSFEFEVTADIGWRVADPARFVRSQERDVPAVLTRELLPLLRDAGRGHPIDASAEAERAVQQAVREATSLGEVQGLRVTCSIRLRRDATERFHQARLRTAQHEVEAAKPEHEATLLRERYESERRAEQIRFYELTLARGGTAALALHLAAHPDETPLVLEHLQAGQNRLLDTQVSLINQALEDKHLEDYQLDEPRNLVAERMKAILRTTDPSTPPEPDPGAGT